MIVALILTAVVAIAAAVLLFREKSAHAAHITEVALLKQQNQTLADENRKMETQIADIQRNAAARQKEDEARFEAIANRVLLANSGNLTAAHTQGLSTLLDPMKQDLDAFRQSFNSRMAAEEAARNSLGDRVRELSALNHKVEIETRRLTDALKGNSRLQGDWGEMVLSHILESAGLKEGREFVTQSVAVSDTGRTLRPDVVINYTDNRKLVIDSKTSMTDYIRMMEADDEQERNRFGKAHVESVKKHIKELRLKSYQELGGWNNLDFVLMFIPNEGAYLAAMNLDPQLWKEAYDNRVIVISPTHLMAVVQMVGQMWQKDRQDRNALEIANKATDMLNRFTAFIDKMQDIEKSLNKAQSSYEDAFRTLSHPSTGLIAKANRITELGVKLKKQLPSAE